ncbi:hypothetical protein JCM11251_000698 [Rhodosporidiobolus azoricus]
MADLVELFLHDSTFPARDAPRLPHLVTLTIYYSTLHPVTLDNFLAPACTPSLRHLAFYFNAPIAPSSGRAPHVLCPSFTPTLLGRLDLLVCSSLDIGRSTVPYTARTPLVLLDCALGGGISCTFTDAPPYLPPHLRLSIEDAIEQWQWDEEDADAVVDDLHILMDCISSASNSNEGVRLLVVPTNFATYYGTDEAIQEAVDDLLRLCEQKKLEVSFEEECADWQSGSMLTLELRQRAGRMRREREREGKSGGK